MLGTENIHANLAAAPPPVAMPEIESRELIAADLRMLISQIETSMRRTATVMDQEHGSDPEGSAEVFLLDVRSRDASELDELWSKLVASHETWVPAGRP